MKVAEREAARRLRKVDGLPMREIAARLGVSVSSVSLWTRDIVLSDEQVSRLERGNHRFGAQNRGWVARAQSARAVRVAAQEHGRELARTGDPLHLAGCMLFWAEGHDTATP